MLAPRSSTLNLAWSHERSTNYALAGDNAAASSLDKLLKAWGLNMDIDKVVADTSFAGRNQQTGDVMPTLLYVTRAGIDANDVATSQIDNLFLPFAGAFTGKPADGLKERVLVKCSANSELIDGLMTTAASQILSSFKASNIEYPLVVHLSGNFKTAFPDGPPSERQSVGRDSVPASTLPRSDAPTLTTGNGAGEVVLVADTDMLNDKVCVRVQNSMGHRVVQPVNGNLNFVQSMVEQFAGADDLISSRSRASISRPFTRVKDMEAKAGKQWEEKVRILEAKQRETEQKIKELQSEQKGGRQDTILSAEQEMELENYQKTRLEVTRDLKQVRKNLRKDTDALEFRTKIINLGAMPVVVAMSGLGLAVVKTKRRAAK